MNDRQWQLLLDVIAGKPLDHIPSGFIIDSPWLPGWSGISTLDYFTNDELWFEVNKKALATFPDLMFLPGFWSEYGMCTEPSAFGAKCMWQQNDLPHAHLIIHDISDIDRITVPDAAHDGLAPFVLNRLKLNRKKIEALGHSVRFAIARGPLNIGTFLMGATEFLIAMRTDPDKIHNLLRIITDYTVSWLELQKKEFDSIDGILVLDDIVGFCGEPDFQEFARPYLNDIFNCLDVSVRFFHNDANGKPCAPHLADLGINMFNFSFLHTMEEMQEWTGGKVTLFGNVPPRDILALGTPQQVSDSVHNSFAGLKNRSRIIASAGGGMSQDTSTENLNAFINAMKVINARA